jgi:uncharacterized protein YndB with AHSA1/START domain
MKRFWTADSRWTIGEVEIDPRKGGSYRVEFGPAGSTPFVEQGEFLEFNPPDSLVYMETVTAGESVMHGPTPCSVVFREAGRNRTEVSVTWTLEPREAADGRRKGWTAQLDLFAALFEGH